MLVRFLGPNGWLEVTDEEAAHIVKKLQQVDIVSLLTEEFLQEYIDFCFKHEGIVDCNVVDAFLKKPTTKKKKKGVNVFCFVFSFRPKGTSQEKGREDEERMEKISSKEGVKIESVVKGMCEWRSAR